MEPDPSPCRLVQSGDRQKPQQCGYYKPYGTCRQCGLIGSKIK